MSALLEGLRVLDLTTVVLGPYCTQILGDLGADVLKVESPEGDSTRFLGPGREEGMSGIFLNLNRNKRSLVLDLKQPAGREVLLELARGADVFFHSMRAAAAARLGLSYDALRAVNPGIVYCSAQGYGRDGPYAGKPAYDDTIQAVAGLAMLQAEQVGKPQYVTSVVADKVTGLTALYAILAALLHRERVGVGQEIEVPMFETMASFVLAENICGRLYEPPLGRAVYDRLATRYRRPYRTADGYLSVIVYTDRQWRNFLDILGRPELFADPRFASFAARTKHVDYLYRFIEDALASRPTQDWLDRLDAAGIPVMPLHTTDELFDDEHLAAVGFFQAPECEPAAGLRFPQTPARFLGAPARIRRSGPRLGEHSLEVLRELGFTEERIDALVAAGVTREGPG